MQGDEGNIRPVDSPAPCPISLPMAMNENARALALAMLQAGREPLWTVLVVGWYYGRLGRDEALRVVEEQAGNTPRFESVGLS
jgi:hypothetical protein